MKKTILFLMLCFNKVSYSQDIVNRVSYNYNAKISYDLIMLDSISRFIVVKPNTQENANAILVKNTTEYQFYKDLINEKIYYNEVFLLPIIPVVDSLNTMKWELIEGIEKVLNYKCNIAKTIFRGRAYTAYYTIDIPLNNGPGKFGGLPGLILEVYSNDGDYKYVATDVALNIQEKQTKYKNSFRNYYNKSKFETWSSFVKIFKNRLDNMLKMEKSEQTEDAKGYPSYFRIDRPEIIYKQAQEGQGVEY